MAAHLPPLRHVQGRARRARGRRCRAARPRARAGAQLKLQCAALIVVDVQRGFDNVEYWGPRNNPDCEANIAQLVEAWRDVDWPIVFVRHDSDEPDSPLRPGQPGNDFKPELFGEPDLLVTKTVNSAFYGEPDLHGWLQAANVDAVVICGITTNHCCETTARMAGNLGYDTWFVRDATHTFDRGGLTADELVRVTDVNLDGEFATVLGTSEMLGHVAWEAPAA